MYESTSTIKFLVARPAQEVYTNDFFFSVNPGIGDLCLVVILMVGSISSSDLLSQMRAKTLLAGQSNNSSSCVTSNFVTLLAYLPV